MRFVSWLLHCRVNTWFGLRFDTATLRTRAGILTFLLLTLPASVRAGALQVGDPLPAASVKDWQGHGRVLSDLGGRVTIVDFWASWCAPCRTLLPELDQLNREYGNRGLVVAVVNVDSSQPPAERFLAEHVAGNTMTLLRDPDAAVLADFGASGMPALYIVDPKGIVRMVKTGYSKDELAAVRKLVKQLLDD